MAKQAGTPLIEVPSRDDIGEWLGLCKYDVEGNARKVKGTSSVAIRSWGDETPALTFVSNYIKENGLGK